MVDEHYPSDFYKNLLDKLNNTSPYSLPEDDYKYSIITSKRILITGAAGSIGSELVRKIARLNPASIGILDINESDLFNLKLELSDFNLPVDIFLCDISRKASLEKIFKQFKPDIVFHAAAYKHIPIMEIFPEEALRVNIVGTFNSALLSGETGVKKFIFISTDKAVNPICKMGKSKKIAEGVIHGIRKLYSTDFIIVRFGNVLGSRGSVSETLIKQILSGGPVTITHPDMRRFFMTISQAVSLSLSASEVGNDGSLFVPNINHSVGIMDLLNELICAFKPKDASHLNIKYTGARQGEKFNESLLTEEELKHFIPLNGFLRVYTDKCKPDCADCINEFSEFESEEFSYIRQSLFSDKTIFTNH